MAIREFPDLSRRNSTEIVTGNAAQDHSVVDTRELALVPVKRSGSKTANLAEVRQLRRKMLLRQRFVRGALAFLFALTISLGVFFFYFASHRAAVSHTAVTASVLPKAAVQHVEEAPVKAAPVKKAAPPAPKSNFNPSTAADDAVIHPSEAQFAFLKQPRGSGALSFAAAAPGAHAARVDTLRLRPVPNSDGRFLGSGSIEWQGGWEPNKPAANLERAHRYIDYLEHANGGKVPDTLNALPAR
jgi:hypothetical protein